MARDDFSDDTKLRLAKRAGFRCSFSGCRRYTVGPSNEAPSAVVCVGIAKPKPQRGWAFLDRITDALRGR